MGLEPRRSRRFGHCLLREVSRHALQPASEHGRDHEAFHPQAPGRALRVQRRRDQRRTAIPRVPGPLGSRGRPRSAQGRGRALPALAPRRRRAPLARILRLMATHADVRRIALSLPGTEETKGHFAFSVPNKGKLKGFIWVWMERVNPKKPRVANPAVLAVRVANLIDKDLLIASEPAKFFTEPHYNGFPAILVRLAEVTVKELRPLIEDAWR